MSTIRTRRLILRPYLLEDMGDYLNLVTDSEVMSHIDGRAVDRTTAADWWRRLINGLIPKGIRWCVRTNVGLRFAGHAMINPTRPGNACELGYILPKSEWGKGYATEIAKALADYSRDEMRLREIYGTVDENHDRSIKVLEKAGLEFFGYDYDKEGRYLVYVLRHKKEDK